MENVALRQQLSVYGQLKVKPRLKTENRVFWVRAAFPSNGSVIRLPVLGKGYSKLRLAQERGKTTKDKGPPEL